MKLKGATFKDASLCMHYWVLNVDEDWVGVNLERHLVYVLPKLIRLMVENKRPEEDILIVMQLYGFYYTMYKMGQRFVPKFVIDTKMEGEPISE